MRFAVKKGDMVTTSIAKTKFSQLNDKRFYFPNKILSLPFGYPSLKELDEFKKEKLLAVEKTALLNMPRLRLFDKILKQEPKIVD